MGPRNPPRLPIELTSPMEAAAADSPRTMVGSTQNEGAQAHSITAVKQSQIMVRAKGWPGIVVNPKKVPAKTSGIAVCSFRSRRPSEDLPMYQTEAVARINGSPE